MGEKLFGHYFAEDNDTRSVICIREKVLPDERLHPQSTLVVEWFVVRKSLQEVFDIAISHYPDIMPSFVETTRSSAMEAVLGNAVDYVSLMATNLVVLFLKQRLCVRFELTKCVFITTKELAIDSVVCYFEWQCFNI